MSNPQRRCFFFILRDEIFIRNGVGATLCRPARRNGVMNCMVYFGAHLPIIVACATVLC